MIIYINIEDMFAIVGLFEETRKEEEEKRMLESE
jgi:hypothetical protein